MPSEKPFHHRATLKQTNKPFKSKHATKGSLKDQAKGKVKRKPVKQSTPRPNFVSKADRRNAAKLEQRKKREELIKANRFFEGRNSTPKIVAVVPLSSDVNSLNVVENIYASVEQSASSISGNIACLNAERFKQKVQFILLDRNFIDILDACKMADFMLLILSAKVEVDQFGELCLKAIQSQGFPSVITSVLYLEDIPQKKRNDVKKSLLSFITHFFPDEEKIHAADQSQETLNILRTICTQLPKQISWRETRPYMLVEEISFDNNNDNKGTLKVTGYARGTAFSANRLIHLQNFGDFQLNQITSCPKQSKDGRDMVEDIKVLDTANPKEQESLIAENEPNFMENEQTWPTEEEIICNEGHTELMKSDDIPNALPGTTPRKIIKRVPKGTSSYQAAWIVDSDNDDSDGYSDEDGDVNMHYEDGDSHLSNYEADYDEEEYEDIEVENKQPDLNDQLDPEEEDRQLKEYLASREKEHRDNLEFPDEVDTPLNIAARIRFQKYRGLQSFRTSPWDPNENLPIDYGRIFQFENYKRTKSRVVSQAKAYVSDVKVGAYITLHIANVPKEVAESYSPSRPFIVFGLFEYEHKTSVLNFFITRNGEYEEPIKSKDPLIMHCGFRRYLVRPLYSQNTLGGKGTNNVHKYEKFINPGRSYIATIYGPINFGNLPVTFYKDTGDNAPILVANGFFLNADPKRIIAKRIILTGYPFKINKKSAVVRYMFFNPADVLWFKPVQLTTKYGRTGHIKESLGTHGYMKCIFDSPIKQQDTVMMNLYKRVFPKWNNTVMWRDGLIGTKMMVSSQQKDKDIGINIDDVEMETNDAS
ncbi:38627_t:CDS:10 [Gigaspora margarita]|uniref:38627_t:CDS:1 n=1 Tax=Gigaspora margarita TaxID=4874 RepID=A0ABN7W4B4_GIGMA|nr:38627_t:CDS:10 [Gigaspora margarita]